GTVERDPLPRDLHWARNLPVHMRAARRVGNGGRDCGSAVAEERWSASGHYRGSLKHRHITHNLGSECKRLVSTVINFLFPRALCRAKLTIMGARVSFLIQPFER